MDALNEEAFNQTVFIRRKPKPDAIDPSDIAHYLVIIEGTEPGQRLEIGSDAISIGRDSRQTLVFADAALSRRHARVLLTDGEAVVEDLGSTNGTVVDGERITSPRRLGDGNVIRVGNQTFRYERRSRRAVEQTAELASDLLKASSYVLSLFPPPLVEGAVLADWRFVPSAQLGGDAFGYDWIDADTFVFYLLDVSGHGVGSAMHSTAILNVLRQRALPHVDFADPAAVLTNLNTRFPMQNHDGLYFTMWYGVYRPSSRTLSYASAGHHPAYLVPPDRRSPVPLGTPALMIGVAADVSYLTGHATVSDGDRVYLFSDGAFEIVTHDRQRWTLAHLLPLLLESPAPHVPEPERIYRGIRNAAAAGPLDDDFSLIVMTFR